MAKTKLFVAILFSSLFFYAPCLNAEQLTESPETSVKPIFFDITKESPRVAQPSALMQAIIANDANALSSALEAGADVNALSSDGVHPMLVAATYAGEAIIKHLVASNIDVSVRDAKGRSAVHLLAMRGAVESMKLVLILKPDLAKDIDSAGWTPLFIAYANGHLPIASYLLEDQRDSVNRAGESGEPMVFQFVRYIDAPESIKHMIANKLNVFKRNAKDEALHETAARAGHTESAKLLEAHYETVLKLYQEKLKQGNAK